jgi:hypothetical protein
VKIEQRVAYGTGCREPQSHSRRMLDRASGGFWSVCVFVLIALGMLLAIPVADAAPIVVDDAYDFGTGPQGWTPQAVGKNGQLPPTTGGKRWTHGSGQWSVNWAPVTSPFVATGNYLTSPSIDFSGPNGDAGIDALRISLAHKFNFSSSLNGVPPAAGQLAYSINGGAFVGLPVSAFVTGSITTPDPLFGSSPLGPYVGQTTLVAPAFIPPAGGYSDLFPLINGGASFTGITPGYTNTGGTWVPSVATLLFPLTVVSDLRIRLINANLGSNCPADAGWDVRYLQVDAAAPEPGSLLLASMGGTLAAGHWLWRRRRRTINSGPPSQA